MSAGSGRSVEGRHDALLSAAIDVLPVGVILADAQGAIVEVNPRARQILGDALPGVFVVRRHGNEGVSAGNTQRMDTHDRPLAWIIERGEPLLGELVDVEDDAGNHWLLQASVIPVRGEDGDVVGATCVIQEVSDAKRRELLSLALNDVNAAVLSLLDIPEHMRSVLADGALALGADAAALVAHDGERVVRHAVGLSDEAAVEALTVFAEASERSGDVITIDTTDTAAPESVRGLARQGYIAALVAPLAVTRQEHDAAVFLSRRRFDDQARDFARKLATSVSLALRSADALARAHSEVVRSRLLEEVAVAASSGLDLEIMAARVLGALRDRLGPQAGALIVREGEELRLVASFGVHSGGLARSGPMESDSPDITSEAVRRGSLLTHDDSLAGGLGGRLRPEALDLAHDRYLSAPLAYGGQILGALDLAWEDRRPFTSDERELVSAIAQTLAQAVENARLFRETVENERLSRALTEIDAYLTAAIDVEEIAEPTLHSAIAALDASSAVMLLADGDEWELVAATRGIDGYVGRRFPAEDLSEAQRALAARGVIVAGTDVPGSPIADIAKEAGAVSMLVVPLLRGDEALGCMYFNRDTPQPFTAGQRDFGFRLGSHVSLTLRTAHLFAAQRNIAQTLQEAMLALPAEIPGALVAHLYQSAALNARVGGDFYDLFELDHGYLGVVIGDVSGKGLDAAVLTALVKNTLRAHAVVKGNTPADVMARVNTVLLKESRPETFVTLFFGMLDRRDGRIVYCNAGHPSAIVLHEDGMAARLAPNSPIAGAFPTASFRNGEGLLGLDDLLFLYTDGLTEARRGKEQYGEERLFVQLARICDTSPEEAIRRVVRDVVAFAGGRLADDVAVLALKRVPLPSRMPVQQKLPLWAGR